MVRGLGAPIISPNPNSSRMRKGPMTRTTISHGWRKTSADHWLKKLEVRTRLFTSGPALPDDLLEHFVELGRDRPHRLDHFAVVAQCLGNDRCGCGRIFDDHPNRAVLTPAHTLDLRQL